MLESSYLDTYNTIARLKHLKQKYINLCSL